MAEAEMREVDDDEGYEDEEAKKNGEMTGYEEETTGEEAAEYTDETEDEADTAYTEGSEDEADTAYAEETEEAAEEETAAEEGEADEMAEPASEEGPGGCRDGRTGAEFRVVINQNRACIQKPEWLSGTFRFLFCIYQSSSSRIWISR